MQPEPSSTQVATPVAGRAEEGQPESPSAEAAMRQASASMPRAPSAIGGAAPKELLLLEGPASVRVGTEPSWSLVCAGGDPHAQAGSPIRWADPQNPKAMLLALDDDVESKWGSVHVEIGTVVSALSTALGSLCDVISPVGQV